MPFPSSSGGVTSKKPSRGGGIKSFIPSGGQAASGGGYTAPTQSSPTYSAPSTSSSGNYSSGGAPTAPPSGKEGGQVRRTGATPPPAEPKKPAVPKLSKYLATDSQYQQDRGDLLKNFRNLRLTNVENRGNLREDRNSTLSRLGEEKEKSLEAMEADFAARGLFGGAEYQSRLGDFNNDFLEQETDARTSFQRNLQQLLRDLRSSKTLRNQNLQQARLEAIRRRAAKYGLKE